MAINVGSAMEGPAAGHTSLWYYLKLFVSTECGLSCFVRRIQTLLCRTACDPVHVLVFDSCCAASCAITDGDTTVVTLWHGVSKGCVTALPM
jgi:hypothetical protein